MHTCIHAYMHIYIYIFIHTSTRPYASGLAHGVVVEVRLPVAGRRSAGAVNLGLRYDYYHHYYY